MFSSLEAKLEDLPEEVLRAICLQLDGRAAAQTQRAARFLHNVLADTTLWHALYARDFGQPTIPPTRVLANGFLDWKGAYGARFLREQRRKVQPTWSRLHLVGHTQGNPADGTGILGLDKEEACAPLYTEGWRGTIYRYDWKAFQRDRQRVLGSVVFMNRTGRGRTHGSAEPAAPVSPDL
ncbi:hypothetical protein CCYA_CCYA08G2319 [Cyanidiococcus yangmingshanensis]|nr:hypothetical protein CCYA_CCYA08G2319 [Cyanidiococcus yangmingshanensis]